MNSIRTYQSLTMPFCIWTIMVFLLSCENLKEKSLLIPQIESEWTLIGPQPDLLPFGLQPEEKSGIQSNQPNDHCIYRTGDGMWHLRACVRGTAAGRIICHWQADSLLQSPWEFTSDIIRADKNAGESLVEWRGEEFLQSPFVVQNEGRYYMFYGGYDTGLDPFGNTIDPALDYNTAEKQICLMISDDGYTWERYSNSAGFSRVFSGPGAARDIFVDKFEDRWYIYYCGHHNMDRTCGAIYARTSEDLIHWSDWKIVHYDKRSEGKRWLPESPCVVYREGYYYLFRTHGPESGTYVYRSADPLNFGHGDVSDFEVAFLPGVIAPEIIQYDGKEYITNIASDSGYHIRIASLVWEKTNN